MAINFNNKVLVVNPTSYFIGPTVLCVGIIAIILGMITPYTGDFLLPAAFWVACGIPTCVIGGIVTWSALRKN